MILVDTNIIVDIWRNPNEEKIDLFRELDVVICPVVEVELIHGARSEKEKREIKSALNDIEMLPIDEIVWEELGEIVYSLRRNGVTVPFQDALIAAVAVRYSCQLWTNDRHFENISKVIDELRLFRVH